MAKSLASFDASLFAVYARRDNREEKDGNIVFCIWSEKREILYLRGKRTVIFNVFC